MAQEKSVIKQENALSVKKNQLIMPFIPSIQKKELPKPERLPPSAAGYLASPKHAYDLKEKIDALQKNIQVENKVFFNQLKGNQPNQEIHSESGNLMRKVIKRPNGKIIDAQKEMNRSGSPTQSNIFQSIYSPVFSDLTDPYNNSKIPRIDSLPSLKQKEYTPGLQSPQQVSQITRKSRYGSLNKQQNSLNSSQQDGEEMVQKALDIFKKGQEKARQQQQIEEEKQRRKEQSEVASNCGSEIKKLKNTKNVKDKLQKLEKIRARIEQIKQLENILQRKEGLNQETTEVIQQKVKKLQEEIGIGENNNQSDAVSRATEDSFLQRLDEISLIEDPNQSDQTEFDLLLTSKSQVSNAQNNTQVSKAGSKSTILESIMEEHVDYFDHLAGKCHCGEITCAKCRVTCAVNQKKPVFLNMQWQSSYSRFFSNHSGSNGLNDSSSKINDVKIERKNFKTSLDNPQDYTSTFKNDYKLPFDSDFKKVIKESKMKDSPLYSLSNYQANFIDWKIEPGSRTIKPAGRQTLVFGTPLLGESTTKKEYQVPPLPYTQLAKPPDQVPLPRYTINQQRDSKENENFTTLIMKTENAAPKVPYFSVPAFEGQYISNQKRDFKQAKQNDKKIERYEKKLEKYEKKLQEEIKNLEAD